MWYTSKEEAEEACKWKETLYKVKFHVLKDTKQENCWWAQRIYPAAGDYKDYPNL